MEDKYKRIPIKKGTKKRLDLAKVNLGCPTYDDIENYLLDLEEGEIKLNIDREKLREDILIFAEAYKNGEKTDYRFDYIFQRIEEFAKPKIVRELE
jgi:hypothetical protein